MSTVTSPSPASGVEATPADWRAARQLAVSLVVSEHRPLTTMRRGRTVLGAVLLMPAVVALVGTFWALGVPPQQDPVGTVVWGLLLTARTAAAAALVFAIVRLVQWIRAPWRLRSELVDVLTDATVVGGRDLTEDLSGRFTAASRWWAPRSDRAAQEQLDDLATDVARRLEPRS